MQSCRVQSEGVKNESKGLGETGLPVRRVLLNMLNTARNCGLLSVTRSGFSGRLRNVGRLTDNSLILGPLPDVIPSSDIGQLADIGHSTDMQKRLCNTTYDWSMTWGI